MQKKQERKTLTNIKVTNFCPIHSHERISMNLKHYMNAWLGIIFHFFLENKELIKVGCHKNGSMVKMLIHRAMRSNIQDINNRSKWKFSSGYQIPSRSKIEIKRWSTGTYKPQFLQKIVLHIFLLIKVHVPPPHQGFVIIFLSLKNAT